MPAQFDESLGLVEVLLILLRQLRGERCKILLAQTDHQKAARKDIVCLAVFIPQSAVHGQTQQLALIVADDGDRVCKGIDSGDRAADSLLQILQLCANGDFLRVFIGLYEKRIQLLFAFGHFFLSLSYGLEVNVDEILGVEDIISVVPSIVHHLLRFLPRIGCDGNRALKRLGDFYIKTLHVESPI